MKRSWLLSVLMIFLFSACEKSVEIDMPKQTPKLGIHAIWDQDSTLDVLVSRTFGIDETPRFSYGNGAPTIEKKLEKYIVPNAKVDVFKDGVHYDELVYDEQKHNYKSATGKKAVAGASYEIRCSAPGFTDVSTPVKSFPSRVVIKSIQVRKGITSSNSTGGAQDEVTIEFDDPEATKNFYWVTIARKWAFPSNLTYYNPIYIYPVDQDIVVPAGFEISTSLSAIDGNYIALKDDSFNGSTKRLRIQVASWVLNNANPIEPVFVSLNSTNEDLFNYIRSRVLTLESPFSTPTQAYSNITNGLGIFGLYASDKREVK
jgi:hypothetical protein